MTSILLVGALSNLSLVDLDEARCHTEEDRMTGTEGDHHIATTKELRPPV